MRNKFVASAILAGTILVGSLFGTGTASATPQYIPDVCDGISDALVTGKGYAGYLVESFLIGKALNADSHQQAENIAYSVSYYCPQYTPGILAAARSMNNG